MLLLDARGRKIIVGVCDRAGSVLYSKSTKEKVDVFQWLNESMKEFDKNFVPEMTFVSITPGDTKSVNDSLHFARVIYI